LKFVPILKETIKLARAALPSTIEIRQDIQLQNDTILANPTQVHQVMMNLFMNAGHAMREEGGMLEIVSRAEHLTEPSLVGLPNLTPGDFLRVSVRDTGHGMDRRTLDQIFDPFFTTKARGEGTGLGLSIVHGIVTGCNGAIQVESRVDEGTTFILYFPLEKGAEEHRREKRKALPKGTEKILLVDDEPDIVEIYSGMLRHLGYTVEAKSSPLDALETFRKDPLGFDLLITDMTMPRLTGDKLAAEVIRIRSEMPVILCTGFSERMEEGRALALGIRAFLKKPITVEDVAHKIRMALDQKRKG
jgi:CheY-like chemotaxis protein